MASLRSTARIARPADEVWKVVSDAAGISAWFPGIEQATAADGSRSCTLAGGHELQEDIVNVDGELRRFQYKFTGGLPVEHHLGTVDVLEDGGETFVVYSTKIAPDELAGVIGPSVEGGVQGLSRPSRGRQLSAVTALELAILASTSRCRTRRRCARLTAGGTCARYTPDGFTPGARGSVQAFGDDGAGVPTGLLRHVDDLSVPVPSAVDGLQEAWKASTCTPGEPQRLQAFADARPACGDC
jgi:uncharacterized protein YndB with AHSA1/START domain